MSKIMIPSFGWAYLHVVIDWGTKKIVGCYLSDTSKTSDWIIALDKTINQQFPEGILESKIKPCLVSDHGSQPTSKGFLKYCDELKNQQIFASYGNLKGNTDTERIIRTIKEDLI